MRTKIYSFLFILFFCTEIYAERCACGSMASGTTIEYEVLTSGNDQSNCCRPGAVIVNAPLPALKMTWRPNRNGTFTLIAAVEYEDPNEAQRDCCPG